MTLSFRRDDLSGAEIRALIDLHLVEMRACSPACSVHAMPVARLREEDVTFWSAWEGDRLAGCGALKAIDRDHALPPLVAQQYLLGVCRARPFAPVLHESRRAAA
ncbi:MAG TPA: hypothetical protein VEZ41_08645 [Allosphingosinicella sp.]|nr:hypothetical protein [Allosphingosinicella sp.]